MSSRGNFLGFSSPGWLCLNERFPDLLINQQFPTLKVLGHQQYSVVRTVLSDFTRWIMLITRSNPFSVVVQAGGFR